MNSFEEIERQNRKLHLLYQEKLLEEYLQRILEEIIDNEYYEYTGPLDEKTRDFCSEYVGQVKLGSEWKSLGITSEKRPGGKNCRHKLKKVINFSRGFIKHFVLPISDLFNMPIVGELYRKSYNGDSSAYIKEPSSEIAKAMANDNNYANSIIQTRLQNGITSGTGGGTSFNRLDLEYSVGGGADFSWEVIQRVSDKNAIEHITVEVKVHNTFDFNKGNRPMVKEWLTTQGRNAKLVTFDIYVTYHLRFKIRYTEIERGEKKEKVIQSVERM